ncbi:hemin uptake protein HemP [Pseudomonas schmalbachii]|uniref:Hemin uptake protein HemP n=1 Tax=Pseudomonas schmalbachii TaxID=2816993 RepID=A0ABS3TWM2_9PSED|nr:hemin uptake protein HemP [Pseudomonas schmalbachii]MBO3277733.1 hemin uptake protein HemP [Pseudomonas schmalbachii]
MNEYRRQEEGVAPDRLKSRTPRRHIPSHILLGEAKELVIEHEGVEYVLRLTRQNKLILTK